MAHDHHDHHDQNDHHHYHYHWKNAENTVVAAIHAGFRVFSQLKAQNAIPSAKKSEMVVKELAADQQSPEQKVAQWLRGVYSQWLARLLASLQSPSARIQVVYIALAVA